MDRVLFCGLESSYKQRFKQTRFAKVFLQAFTPCSAKLWVTMCKRVDRGDVSSRTSAKRVCKDVRDYGVAIVVSVCDLELSVSRNPPPPSLFFFLVGLARRWNGVYATLSICVTKFSDFSTWEYREPDTNATPPVDP